MLLLLLLCYCYCCYVIVIVVMLLLLLLLCSKSITYVCVYCTTLVCKLLGIDLFISLQ